MITEFLLTVSERERLEASLSFYRDLEISEIWLLTLLMSHLIRVTERLVKEEDE